jgi:ABC-type maltose transport system permease subunit
MLGFVGAWNDYMTNVIWLPSYPNLAYGIYVFENYATIQGFTVPETLAGFVIVAIPSVLLWTISQRFVGDRIVAGSLKG